MAPDTIVVLASPERETPAHRAVMTWARTSGAAILDVSEQVMSKLVAKDNPQTLLGVFRQRFAEPPVAAKLARADTWLALEEIRDPGNLGTIIRTADAVGAKGIILIGNCCDPFSREAVRAAMGSTFAVPLVRMERDAFIAWRQSWPGDVVGTHLAAEEDFRTAELNEPVLLVMGSEGPGLTTELTAACSRLVLIPMAGKLDSLNLSIATALALYQARGKYLTT